MQLLDDMLAEYSTHPGTPPPAQRAHSRVPPVRGSRSHVPAATPPPGRVPSKRPGRRIPDPYNIPEYSTLPIEVSKDEAGEFFGQPTVDNVDPVSYHFAERTAKRLSYLANLAIDILSAPGTLILYPILRITLTVSSVATTILHPFPFRHNEPLDFSESSIRNGFTYCDWLSHGFVAEAAHIADIASKLDVGGLGDAWEDRPEPRQSDSALWAEEEEVHSALDAGPSNGWFSAGDRGSSSSSDASSGGFFVNVPETGMSPEID